MHQVKLIRFGFATLLFVATVAGGSLLAVHAQQQEKSTESTKKSVSVPGANDPFRKFQPPRPVVKKPAPIPTVVAVAAPSTEERVQQYRAQKLAAMNAHKPAPKPTTALLLSEIQVVGITRTPRGYAAIVEATPIKLSYVVYPGERFYDGQLVAIEDSRLIFRRETVFSDNRRERSVETKALRQQSPVDAMTAVKAPPATAPAAEEKKPEPKAAATDKP